MAEDDKPPRSSNPARAELDARRQRAQRDLKAEIAHTAKALLGTAEKQDSTLQRRIRERLQELHISPRAASLDAGLGPDAIRTILSGRSRSPRGKNLVALARVLQVEVGYLLGTQDEPFADTEYRRLPDQTAVGTAALHVAMRLRLGAWRTDVFLDSYRPLIGISTLPQYLPGFQFAAIVEDASFDTLFPPDTILHCLSSRGGGEVVRDGDVVILQRSKYAGEHEGGTELTVRRARQISPFRLDLETASTDPALRSSIIYDGGDVDLATGVRVRRGDDEWLEVSGFVMRAYQHISGPPLLGPPTWTPGEDPDPPDSVIEAMHRRK